jgi:hypothetical protein
MALHIVIAAINLVANQLMIAGEYIRIIWTRGVDETILKILEEEERLISNVILTRELPSSPIPITISDGLVGPWIVKST